MQHFDDGFNYLSDWFIQCCRRGLFCMLWPPVRRLAPVQRSQQYSLLLVKYLRTQQTWKESYFSNTETDFIQKTYWYWPLIGINFISEANNSCFNIHSSPFSDSKKNFWEHFPSCRFWAQNIRPKIKVDLVLIRHEILLCSNKVAKFA